MTASKRLPWFKLFHEARTDDKLRVLGDDEHRCWFHLLCFAAEQEERGVVPPMPSFLLSVKVAGGDEELLGRTLAKLAGLDIVAHAEDGAIRFVHFDRRQYGKPSNHPERVAARVSALRQRRKADSNAPVTPLLSRGKREEEEKEKEEGDTPPLSPPTDEREAPPNRKRKLPDDFAVTDEMRQTAESFGVPPDKVDFETERFKDWASGGERKVDWVATWRNWMARAPRMSGYDRLKPPARASPNGRHGGMTADQLADYARQLEQEGR